MGLLGRILGIQTMAHLPLVAFGQRGWEVRTLDAMCRLYHVSSSLDSLKWVI